MTEDAIYVELKYINKRLDELPEVISAALCKHKSDCGAHTFFKDKNLQDKIVTTIYDVAFQKKAKESRNTWIRWGISLPIAGLIIERIVNIWNR